MALALTVGLARPVTLLDEPFNALDAARDALRAALATLIAEGRAALLTTHTDDLTGLPVRALDLQDGRVREAAR
ncbi:hypothetical protein [Deinococcus maricopensis]|uniref:hypothetical protein n=1 Tax=Deinococcus maricopensis TaxID=309887 RepID=UPI0002DC1F62|nr:hypothetical protein [Deinococcus maricopensis]